MDIFNLLEVSLNFIDYVVKDVNMIELNWIGKIIRWLIEGIGITGLGIIVFTVILKTIVLPLDIYSRISTKKQAYIMKKMKPELEKLQHQYENDKNMYNQKVMEVYKQNGYSMFSACIPMLVSLVIFMVVVTQFSAYSQYANLELYRGMVNAYNTNVVAYEQNADNPEGFLIRDEKEGNINYYVDFGAFAAYYDSHDYKVEKDGAKVQTAAELFSGIENDEDGKINAVKTYIALPARQAAADYYHENNAGFLWIKNIWYPDSLLNKEIPSFADFKKTVSKAEFDDYYENSYNEITYNLAEEKETFNGYFILIVLAIGVMLVQQLIMMRTQKDVNNLSTVDGSGAKTNKYTMIAMPIIYGVFSFFYSASFSVYMITNTIYSLITMLIINKVMDVVFDKREAKEEAERYTRKLPQTKKKK